MYVAVTMPKSRTRLVRKKPIENDYISSKIKSHCKSLWNKEIVKFSDLL